MKQYWSLIGLHWIILISDWSGLDSTVLAYLASLNTSPHKTLHLYNVAFQQSDGGYNVPDRATAVQAYHELETLLPHHQLQLILVNVTRDELQQVRANHVRHLLHPLDTVLDDSIGCAIWFAARGSGDYWSLIGWCVTKLISDWLNTYYSLIHWTGVDHNTGDPVTSRARVLLLGKNTLLWLVDTMEYCLLIGCC